MAVRRTGAPRRALPLTLALTLGASLLAAGPVGATDPGPDPRLEGLGEVPQFDDYGIQGEGPARIHDLDARPGEVTPTAAQRATVEDLGATVVRWNDFGTPHVLSRHGGYLSGPAEGEPEQLARAFVSEHHELFRLAPETVDQLAVEAVSPLHEASDLTRRYREGGDLEQADVAHVVAFRQQVGEVRTAEGGTLTVGMAADGRVGWVSSDLSGDGELADAPALSATEALTAAAADVDLDLGELEALAPDDDHHGEDSLVGGVDDLLGEHEDDHGEEDHVHIELFGEDGDQALRFRASELDDPQQALLVAVPTPRDGLRLAWEVTLLDTVIREQHHGTPLAFQSYVDAASGEVLVRRNRVDHLEDDGDAGSINLAGTADEDEDAGFVPQPRWNVFPTNPNFASSKDPSADVRQLWCWIDDAPGCDEEQFNIAARQAWDINPPSAPSFTTDGNYASTAISNASFLTPDTVFQRPVSPTRDYDFDWNDEWFNASCDPSNFATGNDEDAATTNLFVMHNRMHDWSYYLGFTEVNSNLQKSNFGNTDPTRENDPELGQSQAGRLTLFGRDNANQITLNDGTPGITNQYLWQPLAGAFYGVCADGAYDMAIVAHEYAHAITNRMTGGPNSGLGGTQGQSESWSDLAFAEYFRGFDLTASPDANRFALAPYVTGNLETGIRNYAMNDSPLNFSNLEYDGVGTTSPHADGEIWSAVNFDISTRLNATYDGEFPSDDAQLQEACARGERPSDLCPGNRRWAQLMFDGFLLQPTSPSMIDSRDAMLAADLLRYDGENQFDLWEAFALRGYGADATTEDADDRDPRPSFANPLREDNATVTFVGQDTGDGLPDGFEVYVGDYEARSSAIVDTAPDADIGDTAEFAPGTYQLLVRADGFGASRLEMTVEPGEETTVEVPMRRNLASVHNGASADGDGVNLESLIDDTEATNWASLDGAGTASEGNGEGRQVEGRQVTVRLGDQPQTVSEVQLSAALRPADADDDEDSGNQSRFSALRSFDILTCDASPLDTLCEDESEFTVVLRSGNDAFDAGRPRPLAPDLTLRPFEVIASEATHVRLRVRDNQCTGAPAYRGENNPDDDPLFEPDCATEAQSPDRALLSPPFDEVRAAELQVFGPSAAAVDDGPVVDRRGRGSGNNGNGQGNAPDDRDAD